MRAIKMAAIGCGAFGSLALEQFLKVDGLSLASVFEPNQERARALAVQHKAANCRSVDELLSQSKVNLVYISAPPDQHAALALQSLQAGKHVIVEKPFALTLADAEKICNLARENKRIICANMMQRYNPLFEKVTSIIANRPLGAVLHAFFENYAADEKLHRDHWFWDPKQSGGIFLEHGVHFFDLFEGWLGPGKVCSAQRVLREAHGLEEQVQCCVNHSGVLVSHYHAFCHPDRLDRQELRIVFERGDIRLFDWIPRRVELTALVGEVEEELLCKLFPGAALHVEEHYAAEEIRCSGRHKTFEATRMISLSWEAADTKWKLYCQLLSALAKDQVQAIRDARHHRHVTEKNGVESMRYALRARELAGEAERHGIDRR